MFSKTIFGQINKNDLQSKWVLDSLRVNDKFSPLSDFSKESYFFIKSDSVIIQNMGDSLTQGKWYLSKDSITLKFDGQETLVFKILKQEKKQMIWMIKNGKQKMAFYLRTF